MYFIHQKAAYFQSAKYLRRTFMVKVLTIGTIKNRFQFLKPHFLHLFCLGVDNYGVYPSGNVQCVSIYWLKS